ncbi:acyclic terpene utilization AtuA family protein [Nocardia aurantiaca]|uniref:Acyclic terpene utilization AtuA family protein n=1 Tax=Nocardia aurantiaca TaxID=2675850 RepID=A0A6I3L170_9NOCA|nr:acyclic terpene utilization AtuA family protein [Nocardia aurantiaca]MTE16733.1 acyclic terpene utilization AtuA family protein [Nocardia aurantiaca]
MNHTLSTRTEGSLHEPLRPVRIANCSGFYGDTLAAARNMVEGGPIDVLTGDYLAELTIFILYRARRKDPAAGYAKTFLTQVEDVLGTCLDRGVRIVANAGGLAPATLAEEIGKLAANLDLSPKIAYVDGDDIVDRLGEMRSAGEEFRHLDTGRPLSDRTDSPVTANAYLGGWGITQALRAGADVVVTGRVADAALVSGPAAWWHGWAHDDFDRLAGAIAAGHVIECGPQACGGNYPFLDEITDRRYPGFPLAEIAADGSSVITKHPGTGGIVSTGTVTAQLLYEIGDPAYAGPDAVSHFDTLELTQQAPNRVEISGVRGSAPPDRLKVAMNFLGGYRNTMTFVITGLDIEEKARWARQQMFELLGGEERFDEVDVQLLRFDHADADRNAEATAHLRVTVKGSNERVVGREFSGVATAMAVGGYAGLHTTTPPTPASVFGVYWPTLLQRDLVDHRVTFLDGKCHLVPNPPAGGSDSGGRASIDLPEPPDGPTRRVPLGTVVGARSGDKGGNANVGLWTRDEVSYSWLRSWLDVERFRELVPEAAGLEVRRYELPNLRALNFVIVGLLGDGVAASTRPDPQAKGLGEYVRSRYAEIPESLLDTGPDRHRPGTPTRPDIVGP